MSTQENLLRRGVKNACRRRLRTGTSRPTASASFAGLIVSLHVATGAAAGAAVASRLGALALGPLLHAAGDRMPHTDIASRGFETVTGVAAVLALGLRRGALDPATVGAVAASAPDLEHALRLPRPGGRKLFPTHRKRSWHGTGGVSASVQLVAAGTILGVLLSTRAKRRRRHDGDASAAGQAARNSRASSVARRLSRRASQHPLDATSATC